MEAAVFFVLTLVLAVTGVVMFADIRRRWLVYSSSEEVVEYMKKCNYCGADNERKATKCEHCGGAWFYSEEQARQDWIEKLNAALRNGPVEKHCRKCGAQLVGERGKVTGHTTDTGEPIYKYLFICPNGRWYNFGHRVIEGRLYPSGRWKFFSAYGY